MLMTIKFKCDNDVFANQGNQEIARVLRQIADGIDDPGEIVLDSHLIFDSNGNRIGMWEIA